MAGNVTQKRLLGLLLMTVILTGAFAVLPNFSGTDTMEKTCEISWEGDTVEINILPAEGPWLTYGLFNLKNEGDKTARITLGKLWYQAGDQMQEIKEYFAYLLPDYELVDKRRINLPSGSEVELRLSFSRIEVNLAPGLSHVVQAELMCGEEMFKTSSEIEFVEERPLLD